MLFCDNQSVVAMVNNNSSSCKNCMVLIRILVLHSMKMNARVYAKYVTSRDNKILDLLSRLKIDTFKKLTKDDFEPTSTAVPGELWPMSKLWLK